MDDNYIMQQLLDRVKSLIDEKLSDRYSVELCQVVSNNNGSGKYDVVLVSDDSVVIRDVVTSRKAVFNNGDYVYVLKIQNKLSNGIILGGNSAQLRKSIISRAGKQIGTPEEETPLPPPVKKYGVYFTLGDYVTRGFLSTSANATTGAPSGTQYKRGQIVYYYVEKFADTADYKYVCSGTQISGNIYRLGYIVVENMDISLGNISSVTRLEVHKYPISYYVVNGYARGDSQISAGGTATVRIYPNSHYSLPARSDFSVIGAVISGYNTTTGQLTLFKSEEDTQAVSVAVVCPTYERFNITFTIGEHVVGVYYSINGDPDQGPITETTTLTNAIRYGESLEWYAVPETGYSVSNPATNPYKVNKVTSDQTFSITGQITTYPVTFTLGMYVTRAFTSTSDNVTTGNASGYEYPHGTTVYYFVEKYADGEGFIYECSGTQISGNVYRLGSIVLNETNGNLGALSGVTRSALYPITVVATNCSYTGDNRIAEGGYAYLQFTPDPYYRLPTRAELEAGISGASIYAYQENEGVGLLTLLKPLGNTSPVVVNFTCPVGTQYKLTINKTTGDHIRVIYYSYEGQTYTSSITVEEYLDYGTPFTWWVETYDGYTATYTQTNPYEGTLLRNETFTPDVTPISYAISGNITAGTLTGDTSIAFNSQAVVTICPNQYRVAPDINNVEIIGADYVSHRVVSGNLEITIQKTDPTISTVEIRATCPVIQYELKFITYEGISAIRWVINGEWGGSTDTVITLSLERSSEYTWWAVPVSGYVLDSGVASEDNPTSGVLVSNTTYDNITATKIPYSITASGLGNTGTLLGDSTMTVDDVASVYIKPNYPQYGLPDGATITVSGATKQSYREVIYDGVLCLQLILEKGTGAGAVGDVVITVTCPVAQYVINFIASSGVSSVKYGINGGNWQYSTLPVTVGPLAYGTQVDWGALPVSGWELTPGTPSYDLLDTVYVYGDTDLTPQATKIQYSIVAGTLVHCTLSGDTTITVDDTAGFLLTPESANYIIDIDTLSVSNASVTSTTPVTVSGLNCWRVEISKGATQEGDVRVSATAEGAPCTLTIYKRDHINRVFYTIDGTSGILTDNSYVTVVPYGTSYSWYGTPNVGWDIQGGYDSASHAYESTVTISPTETGPYAIAKTYAIVATGDTQTGGFAPGSDTQISTNGTAVVTIQPSSQYYEAPSQPYAGMVTGATVTAYEEVTIEGKTCLQLTLSRGEESSSSVVIDVTCTPIKYQVVFRVRVGSGVSSLTYTIESETPVTIGSGDSNTLSLEHGTLYTWYATPARGYSLSPGVPSQSDPFTGAVTSDVTCDPTAQKEQFAVSFGFDTGYIEYAYTSTDPNAILAEENSGAVYDYGDTVYVFVKMNANDAHYTYSCPDGTLISGRYYRVDTITIPDYDMYLGTLGPNEVTRTVQTYTLTIHMGTNLTRIMYTIGGTSGMSGSTVIQVVEYGTTYSWYAIANSGYAPNHGIDNPDTGTVTGDTSLYATATPVLVAPVVRTMYNNARTEVRVTVTNPNNNVAVSCDYAYEYDTSDQTSGSGTGSVSGTIAAGGSATFIISQGVGFAQIVGGNVTVNFTATGYAGSSTLADFSNSQPYTITYNITNGEPSPDAPQETAYDGSEPIEIMADSFYMVPETVSVVGSTYIWDRVAASWGELTLTGATQDVTVNVSCVRRPLVAPYIEITYNSGQTVATISVTNSEDNPSVTCFYSYSYRTTQTSHSSPDVRYGTINTDSTITFSVGNASDGEILEGTITIKFNDGEHTAENTAYFENYKYI